MGRIAYSILVGKPEGKRPLGRPRRRCENIRMDPREIEWVDLDLMHLAEDMEQWRAFVNTAMNKGFIKGGEFFFFLI